MSAVAVQCLSESLGVDLANAEQTKALGVEKSLQVPPSTPLVLL